MSFLEGLGETLKSLGGAAVAPLGAVVDLATVPFDDKDDDFGSVVGKLANQAGNVFDPLMNENTWTGYGFGKTMDSLEWVYREGISEPLSTTGTVLGHSVYDRNPLDILDKDNWAQAYDVAQNRSAGQAFSLLQGPAGAAAILGKDRAGAAGIIDPLNPDAYKTLHGQSGLQSVLSTAQSGTGDFALRWYLDPGVVVGKAAAVRRQHGQLHRLRPGDRVALFDQLGDAAAAERGIPVFRENTADRFDKWMGFIQGDNRTGKVLSPAEIYISSPELRRSAEGRGIASLVGQALKDIDDEALQRNTIRRIMAVAGGDQTQIMRLGDEIEDAKHVADALANMRKGGTVDLTVQALNDNARLSPEWIADVERQLTNLNSKGQIDAFLKGADDHLASLTALNETRATLDFLPGAHKGLSNRALKREHHGRVIDKVAEKHDQALAWSTKRLTAEANSSLFQKGLHQMPLLVIKTAGLAASPYTKAPRAISDAMRQTHYVGVANLHDWGGSTDQLNSMMRVAGVDDVSRLKHLSEAMGARSEMDKQAIINRIENTSMKALSERHGVDSGFIEQLMMKGTTRRSQNLGALRGRAYASTMNAANKGSASAQTDLAKLRVDQVLDEQGVPVALPLLESQLANSVPLVDIHLAKKVIEREESATRFKALSDAWGQEAIELGRLDGLRKAARSKGRAEKFERLIRKKHETMDYLVDAGTGLTRIWKFSVLFRLGYPIRVVSDDHMRIWTQLNAGTFYLDNGSEALGNLRWNQFGGRKTAGAAEFRKALAERDDLRRAYGNGPLDAADFGEVVAAVKTLRKKKSPAEAKAQAQALVDRLDPEGDVATYYHRLEDVRRAQRDLNRLIKQGGDADLIREKEGAVAYLQEQLGDLQDPAFLRAALQARDAQLKQGPKAFLPEKKTVGQAEVLLPGGYRADGAFAGPYGKATKEATSSNATFDAQVGETGERMYNTVTSGSWRTILPDEAGHEAAWMDVLNHQFRNSSAAMFFVKNPEATADDFARWLKEPKQAHLVERLPHYAHDPIDWANRIQQMVHDYIPSEDMRAALASGHLSRSQMSKLISNVQHRPAVHGQAAATQFGNNSAVRAIGDATNNIYRMLGEMPTDRLSRHPFFSSLYKKELTELHLLKKQAYEAQGRAYTQADIEELQRVARKKAMNHLKQTLFDLSAHSHAAHVMRFVSPFFAAHQESLARWWRIASDDPSVIRRFQQAADIPSNLGIIYDVETGEPVERGEWFNPNHRIIMRVPDAFGGEKNPIDKWLKKMGGDKYWEVNQNAFNLVLQGGLMNPGTGPVVSFPLESLAQKYQTEGEIERVARILNPYPPDSPKDVAFPAWLKRGMAFIQGEGNREWNNRFVANQQELLVAFAEENGRTPSESEVDDIMLRAGRQTNMDIFLMFMQNATSPAPAKPGGKYAVVQRGIDQIRNKAAQEGRDYDWVREQVKEKYGDIYMPLMYSTGSNLAGLTQSRAEASGINRYRPLLKKVDPRLTRMVIGVPVEQMSKDDPAMAEYSGAVRSWLKTQQAQTGIGGNYIDTKNPRETMLDSLVSQGWEKYTALTAGLQSIALERGLKSYEDAPDLVKAKSLGVDTIEKENFAWRNEYNSFDRGKYDRYLDDMRQIASNKTLTGDTERQDIYWLGQYLALRGGMAQVLEQKKAAGFSGSYEAKENLPMMQAFRTALAYIREKSTYFDTHMYNGVVEFDPWLNVTETPEEKANG